MVRSISALKFPVKRISAPDDVLTSNRHQFRLHGCLLTPWTPNRHWGCLHQTGTRHYWDELTTVKFLFRQQTSRVVICRTAQTQFVNSLFPYNPVLVTVTLYLGYLLFRYFQYAFHPDVFFDLAHKYGRNSHYSIRIRARPDAFPLASEDSYLRAYRDLLS